jgi:sarcosine oxidase, subunit beta
LLERGLVGQQASGVNFGNVRRQARYLPQLPLANRSREIWGRLPQLIGEDAEFLASGHVRIVYDQAQLGVIEQYAVDAKHWDLDLEVIGREALRKRFPFFGPEIVGGSYSPNDGHANPRLAAPAFGRAAARAGARVIENCEVLDVQKDGLDFQVSCADGTNVSAPTGRADACSVEGDQRFLVGEDLRQFRCAEHLDDVALLRIALLVDERILQA